MREIKFRCWDKVDKCMKRVYTLDFGLWWVGTDFSVGERNSFKNEETDRHILMQYTGLKDKNGVEIYEGDYLKFGLFEYVVEFKKAKFLAIESNTRDVVKTEWSLGEMRYNQMVVIGNIHEVIK